MPALRGAGTEGFRPRDTPGVWWWLCPRCHPRWVALGEGAGRAAGSHKILESSRRLEKPPEITECSSEPSTAQPIPKPPPSTGSIFGDNSRDGISPGSPCRCLSTFSMREFPPEPNLNLSWCCLEPFPFIPRSLRAEPNAPSSNLLPGWEFHHGNSMAIPSSRKNPNIPFCAAGKSPQAQGIPGRNQGWVLLV